MASLACTLLVSASDEGPLTNCTLLSEVTPVQMTCIPQATPCASTTIFCAPLSFNPALYSSVTACVAFNNTEPFNGTPVSFPSIASFFGMPSPVMAFVDVLTYPNDGCTGALATFQSTGTGQCLPTLSMNGTFSRFTTDDDEHMYEHRYSDANCTKSITPTDETPTPLSKECTSKRTARLLLPWPLRILTFFDVAKDPSQCTDTASISHLSFGSGLGCTPNQQSCEVMSYDTANSSAIIDCGPNGGYTTKRKDFAAFDEKAAIAFKNRAYVLTSNFMDDACKLGMENRAASLLNRCYSSSFDEDFRSMTVSIKYTIAANGSVSRASYNGTGCAGTAFNTSYFTADGSCSGRFSAKLFNVNASQSTGAVGQTPSSKSGAFSVQILSAAAVAAMFSLFV
ncbi:hypothetical protein HDU81_001945 [Chytriomyces hyalinus]|nr:hypothetical protein HDU81_001940 [Chytriomyces hyalinus]KAJ3233882.1 hypothetical protein HDU81_001945 [Chytriomyces hyalinus]